VTTEPPLPTAVYRYWVCDLRTGNKIAQLPLRPSGELPERIGDVSTAQFACDQYDALKMCGDFIGVTTPGRTMVIVEREYKGDSTSDILWAGIIVLRQAGSATDAQLNCSTIASYLNRRHVGTHTYSAGPGETDGKIITDLLGDAAAEGLDFILDVDCPTLRAVRFLATENKTVLQALQDLAAMDGGPEWTIKAQWTDASRTSVDLVFVARTQLGWSGTPNARFDFPGCINSYEVDDDFSEGHGANYVIALNSAGGAAPAARDNTAITQQGWPRWEQLVTPSGDLNIAGLTGAAQAALKWRARGQITNSVKVSLTYGPQYRRDLELGDNATWFVSAPKPGEDPPSPRHPDGHQETIRVIGISLDIPNDTYTPVLWNPYLEAA
jgi:hypothetical protein